MFDQLTAFMKAVSSFVWGPFLLIPLLLLTGFFLTLRLRGIQFTQLGHSLYLGLIVRKEKGGEGDISHFQALMTALAATVGTGNIVGVATAIGAGGPGALFWMWMTGLVGMATKYSEALLSVKVRFLDVFVLGAAGGPGLAGGVGTPQFRILGQIAYDPQPAKPRPGLRRSAPQPHPSRTTERPPSSVPLTEDDFDWLPDHPDDETPSERQIAYYAERARGGMSLIGLEVCSVDPLHRYQQHSLGLHSDEQIEGHKRLVDAIHAEGVKVQPQLSHPGPESLAPFFKQLHGIQRA